MCFRRPRPRFKHSGAGFSGDPVTFVKKTLDSRVRGNDNLVIVVPSNAGTQ